MTVSEHRIWIGTYAAKGGQGLIAATVDSNGAITIGDPEPGIVDASYGIWCGHLQVAWFVCEQEQGTVSAWRQRDGRWHPLGSVSTGGAAPCFLDVSRDRQYLAVANYGSGSVATILLDRLTGAPLFRAGLIQNDGQGADPDRQESPHPHCVRFVKDGRVLMFTDLGLDRIFTADVGPCGILTERRTVFQAQPGFGPRHLAPIADATSMVVNGELASGLALLEPKDGVLTSRTLVHSDQSEKPGNLGGHLLVEGDVVWTSNRGADTLAAFKITNKSLELMTSFFSGGQSPRQFARVGQYFLVAHEESGSITAVDIAGEKVAFTAEVPGAAFILVGPET